VSSTRVAATWPAMSARRVLVQMGGPARWAIWAESATGLRRLRRVFRKPDRQLSNELRGKIGRMSRLVRPSSRSAGGPFETELCRGRGNRPGGAHRGSPAERLAARSMPSARVSRPIPEPWGGSRQSSRTVHTSSMIRKRPLASSAQRLSARSCRMATSVFSSGE
jgi:hypothetical protein